MLHLPLMQIPPLILPLLTLMILESMKIHSIYLCFSFYVSLSGLSLRFQVAGHMKLVGGVPSIKPTISEGGLKILKCRGPEKSFPAFSHCGCDLHLAFVHVRMF